MQEKKKDLHVTGVFFVLDLRRFCLAKDSLLLDSCRCRSRLLHLARLGDTLIQDGSHIVGQGKDEL